MNPALPIHQIRAALARGVPEGRLVIEGPTGSGKSTQVPQFLLDDGLSPGGEIVVLQPRRIAARLLAARVASERGEAPGGAVGYQVRLQTVAGPRTRIRYVTEGVLLRRLLGDPTLRGVGAVVFDEFHERHLHGDVALALLLDVQRERRPDLLLVVMSATLDAAGLEAYLRPCRVLRAEGRVYPVEVRHLPRPLDPRGTPVWDAAAEAFERAVAEQPAGHTLVFMPGAYEIHRTLQAIQASPAARGRVVLPLHGQLPPAEQDRAVASSAQPRVIVATNVAETSLTIEGVRLVIDSGLARVARYDARRGLDTLHIEPISRASAEQRSGRAGRTGPGLCVRLWTEAEHARRPSHDAPELHRVDLAESVLALKTCGVHDPLALRWLDPPPELALQRAIDLLVTLGALEPESERLTGLGRRMAAFPVHPRYARMLLESGVRGCTRPVALLAALTQDRDILVRRVDRDTEQRREDLLGEEHESDLFLLMRAWMAAERSRFDVEACRRLGIHARAAREAGELFARFLALAESEGLPVEAARVSSEDLRRCILAGFLDRLACRMDAGTLRCRLLHGRQAVLARESGVRNAPLLVATEIVEVEGRATQVLLSGCTAVERAWLDEVAPGAIHRLRSATYDRASRSVTAEEQTLFRDLQLEVRRVDPLPEEAAHLLADAILAGEIPLRDEADSIERWVQRVNFVATRMEEAGLSPIDAAARRAILEQACHGLTGARALRDQALLPAFQAWLDGAQRGALERLAPERVELSNGRKARVLYRAEGDPCIAMRLQELFGVREIPRILGGRCGLLIQILGPNQRPVQITADLGRFWSEHYPRVRQELRRRYPRHAWPEDPAAGTV